MKNSYKFFKNDACKYFPCHEVSNEDNFNCMFCYCPLYFTDECGGNYEIIGGVKSCMDCNIPHGPNSYEYMLEKVIENIEKRKAEYERDS